MEEGQAHHTMKSQAPSLDRLEPCEERLAHDEERLDFKRRASSHDEERLHKERLGGSLDRLGPSTFTFTWVKLRFGMRRPCICYMEAH